MAWMFVMNFFVAIILLSSSLGIDAASDIYIMTAPKMLWPRSTFVVTVSLENEEKTGLFVYVECWLTNTDDDSLDTTGSSTVHIGDFAQLELEVGDLDPEVITDNSVKLHCQSEDALMEFYNYTTHTVSYELYSIFIQLDKPIYKPSETVHIRTFMIDRYLTPVNLPVDITISDASNNILEQWTGLVADNFVISKDLVLSSKPNLGDWKITCFSNEYNLNLFTEKIFEVDEYVLPDFEVLLNVPSYIVSSDSTITGTISAVYTYGNNVKGEAVLTAKIDPWYGSWNSDDTQPKLEMKINVDGENTDFSIKLSKLLKMYDLQVLFSYHSVSLIVSFTETLTGNTEDSDFQTVPVYDHGYQVSVLDATPSYFKPGLLYPIYIHVEQPDGKTLTDLTPYDFITIENLDTQDKQIIYGQESAIFLTETVSDSTYVNYMVVFREESTYHDVTMMNSPSDNFLQILLDTEDTSTLGDLTLQSGDEADFIIQCTELPDELTIQVIARGVTIYTEKQTPTDYTESDTGEFKIPISFTITEMMAPSSQLLVYYIRSDNHEIVNDVFNFAVEGAFTNDVTIEFSTDEAEPGQNLEIDLTADPLSEVFILAVDQSVLLMGTGNDITQSDVLSQLEKFNNHDINSPSISSYDYGMMFKRSVGEQPLKRSKRMIWYPYFHGGSDAYSIFENSEFEIATNALVYKEEEDEYDSRYFMYDMVEMAGGGPGPVPAMAFDSVAYDVTEQVHVSSSVTTKTRSYFPETWLWSSTVVGDDGKAVISTTIPDTITTWVASAFALSDNALGVAATTSKIKCFREFFISINKPYSVVRGEEVALQVTIFNYVSADQKVEVELGKSNDFEYLGNNLDAKTEVTVPANDGYTVYFPIVMNNIGDIEILITATAASGLSDAIQDVLLVKPEGVSLSYSYNMFIDLTDTDDLYSKTLSLLLPDNYVDGSQSAEISIIGDIMGPSIQGLDKLLAMPYGCGEQNMINFVPNILVCDYLNITNQLTTEILDKALTYMKSGYQRELTYQHRDGSFSAFGDRDPSGSSWLTAFVLRSFAQADQYIYIDHAVIDMALSWLIRQQDDDGSFTEPGRIIDTFIQGGINSEVTLTAYVLTSLVELSSRISDLTADITEAQEKAYSYLTSVPITDMDDVYTAAIVIDALMLYDTDVDLTTYLETLATVDGDSMYWSAGEDKEDCVYYWSCWQSSSHDIETTAYAVIAFINAADYVTIAPAVKWLTEQRNQFGGYSSTQDTILALQALAQFASSTYRSDTDIQIEINGIDGNNFISHFEVTSENTVVLQIQEIPDVKGGLQLTAAGLGIALAQVTVYYNVPDPYEEPLFDLDLTVVDESNNNINVISCTVFTEDGESGMAIMDVEFMSGFSIGSNDLTELQDSVSDLMLAEVDKNKLYLYFNKISSGTETCVTLKLRRINDVGKNQPAAISVYDYYQPLTKRTSLYASSSLSEMSVCDICSDCGCGGSINGGNSYLTTNSNAVSIIVMSFLMIILLR